MTPEPVTGTIAPNQRDDGSRAQTELFNAPAKMELPYGSDEDMENEGRGEEGNELTME